MWWTSWLWAALLKDQKVPHLSPGQCKLVNKGLFTITTILMKVSNYAQLKYRSTHSNARHPNSKHLNLSVAAHSQFNQSNKQPPIQEIGEHKFSSWISLRLVEKITTVGILAHVFHQSDTYIVFEVVTVLQHWTDTVPLCHCS